MPASSKTIVDAVVDDILALGLADFRKVRKYAPRQFHNPDELPALEVWTMKTSYRLLSGAVGLATYNRVHPLTITWWAWNPDGSETGGTGDPDVELRLEAIKEPLIAHLATYASGMPGGLGPPEGMLVGTLVEAEIGPAVLGGAWGLQITMNVEEAA